MDSMDLDYRPTGTVSSEFKFHTLAELKHHAYIRKDGVVLVLNPSDRRFYDEEGNNYLWMDLTSMALAPQGEEMEV